ncbi:cold shock small protein YmcF, partial [Escherichia coli]|uniref:cold shock small protein YmcF n=1 Tax=Escherichia coli TaxID=562 RepID=UPI003F8D1DE8
MLRSKVAVITQHLHFRCPFCHGSLYRSPAFDVTERNPLGAKCQFGKSAMFTSDNVGAARSHNHSSPGLQKKKKTPPPCPFFLFPLFFFYFFVLIFFF